MFKDYDEFAKNMDGTDDLTQERAIGMLIKDVRARGIDVEEPSDPPHDPEFIRTGNAAHDIGGPRSYPKDARIAAARARFRPAP